MCNLKSAQIKQKLVTPGHLLLLFSLHTAKMVSSDSFFMLNRERIDSTGITLWHGYYVMNGLSRYLMREREKKVCYVKENLEAKEKKNVVK